MSPDPLAEIRASFFIECEDLLEALQDALGVIAAGPDPEAVNTVFRAVHSIKGGAAAFALDSLVAFAHRLETVLDRLRSGRMEVTAEAVKLLLQAADMLQDHVRAARGGGAALPGADAVLSALEGLTGCAGPEPAAILAFTPVALALPFGEKDGNSGAADVDDAVSLPETRRWRVRFTPHAALYASGNEALLVLRALCALGRARVTCDIPPDLAIADDAAEQPRLSWHVDLEADVRRAEIEDVFDFVADVCALEIREASALPAPLQTEASATDAAEAVVLGSGDHAPAPEKKDRHASMARFSGAVTDAAATIRVDLDKIDRLLNLVGELVINQAMLSQSIGSAGLGNAQVTAGLEAFLTLTRDLQDSVMSVRAQPVKPLFQRMARVVREASASLGREVRLLTGGEATEVDRTVIERLAEPLTHMIRNAVGHGIEDAQARLAAGKPREGRITLTAARRADRIVIEVADDGAGVDRGKVLDIARTRGLLPVDAMPTETEIDNLLFLPGFSTAGAVSALSGRGVGMDVVKGAVAALGGRIAIASEPGRGTTFSITLPLTLAVLEGMVIQAAGQTFVVPLSAIAETAALTPDAIKKVGSAAELLHIRGELIPLIDLGARLGFRRTASAKRGGVVLLTAQDDGSRAALIVDAIMEQRQVVIKGIGPGIGRMPGIAAATILGDGKIALILDPADLVRGSADPDLALAG